MRTRLVVELEGPVIPERLLVEVGWLLDKMKWGWPPIPLRVTEVRLMEEPPYPGGT